MMGSWTDMLASSAAGLPSFLLYLVASIALVGLFALVYTTITPQREFRLLRQGNNAAALSFGGALIGFVVPLSKAVSQSASLPDLFIWAGAALVVQLLAYYIAVAIFPDFSKRIIEGQVSSGAFAGALSIGLGILNASAMTYQAAT